MTLVKGGNELGGAGDLLASGYRLPRPSFHAANIEDMRTSGNRSIGGQQRWFVGECGASVIKGVRCAVDDGHDQAVINAKCLAIENKGPWWHVRITTTDWARRCGEGDVHGTMMSMALLFVLVGIVVITATFLLATNRWPDPGLVADPGDRLPPSLVDVPLGRLNASDIEELQLDQATRGYRMADVDAVLTRLTEEIAARDAQLAQVQAPEELDLPERPLQ